MTRRRVPLARAALLAIVAAVCVGTVQNFAQVVTQLPIPERQLPVFRADAHLVRVDAYPTDKDGNFIRGLTADDFELTEDGVPQSIDTAEFFEFERWEPGSERPNPRDQRESFRLAADPSYRVLVVYLNRISWRNSHYVREPLIETLTREIGPRDLFGLLLPQQEASDLILGRFTPSMQAQTNQFLRIIDHNEPWSLDAGEQQLLKCFGQGGGDLIRRWRVDNLYRDLEGIITILGTIRDERKSILLVTEEMPGVMFRRSRSGTPPAVGGSRGTPPPPRRPLPGPSGLSSGIFLPDFNSASACQMLASSIPETFPERFEELIDLARRMNVAINVVNPSGLTLNSNWTNNSYLRELASKTGGIAIVNNNGIRDGFKRIVNDMPAYYVLGYYTSNTKWDGRIRQLKVKLKSTGQTVRARFEYQSPTAEDMEAMRKAAAAPPRPTGPTPEESAMNVLARIRPDASLQVHGALRGQTLTVAVEIPTGLPNATRWRGGAEVLVTATDPQGHTVTGNTVMELGARGAEVQLLVPSASTGPWQVSATVSQANDTLEDYTRLAFEENSFFGHPLLYRAASQPAAPYRAVADPQFWRTERLRAEWQLPPLGDMYTLRARLLQPSGTSLSYEPPLQTEVTDEGVQVRLDLRLSSMATGDYLIEVTAEHQGDTHRTLQAIRVLR